MKPKTKICKLLYFVYILPSIHFRGKLSLFLNIVDYGYVSFTEQYSDFCYRFSSRFSWSVAFIRCRWEIARYWQSEQYFFSLSVLQCDTLHTNSIFPVQLSEQVSSGLNLMFWNKHNNEIRDISSTAGAFGSGGDESNLTLCVNHISVLHSKKIPPLFNNTRHQPKLHSTCLLSFLVYCW